MKVGPCDWDRESHCVGCGRPASHRRLLGMVDDVTTVELVCCMCALGVIDDD